MTPSPKALLLAGRTVVSVGGADARSFLQGLITNDIDKVTPDRAIYAALLTPQGKYLHDFFIAEGADALLLDCAADGVDDLIRRLRMYKLRSDVSIDDRTGDFQVYAVLGGWADGPGASPGDAQAVGGGIAFTDPRMAALGARLILPAGAEPDMADGAFEDYERLRLSLGVPDGPRDIEAERTLILEADMDELNGVDFHKGCYVGQELTARMKHRGKVRKKLVPVEVSGPLPDPGTAVTVGGKTIGAIRSGFDGQAMALIRLEDLDGVEWAECGAARVKPRIPDWLEQ